MTNQERLDNLLKAKHLIRRVEFSYPMNSPERKMLYKFAVKNFSFLSEIDLFITMLVNMVHKEAKDNNGSADE